MFLEKFFEKRLFKLLQSHVLWQAVYDRVKNDHKDIINNEVMRCVYGEKFIDEIVNRINKKQLKGK